MNAAAKAFWSVVKTSVLPDLGSGPREVVLTSAELSNRLDLALKGCDGYGGGHEHACGLVVKQDDWDKFYAVFSEEVEKKIK